MPAHMPIGSFTIHSHLVIIAKNHIYKVYVKVKQSRYRPGVAQRVPGS